MGLFEWKTGHSLSLEWKVGRGRENFLARMGRLAGHPKNRKVTQLWNYLRERFDQFVAMTFRHKLRVEVDFPLDGHVKLLPYGDAATLKEETRKVQG